MCGIVSMIIYDKAYTRTKHIHSSSFYVRFHIPGPALGYTISPDPSFPHAHAVMRVRACACTEGSGYQTKVMVDHSRSFDARGSRYI